jgi:5-deoxy-5-amino-3-dehydroquinate synthase
VVASDEREGGRRAVLNYGHTLAHALEIATEHRLAHGEAVAIGLVYAARVAEVLGRIPPARVGQHDTIVADAYGLEIGLPGGASPEALVDLMARDKKALDGLTFVLDGPRGVETVAGVGREVALQALAAMPGASPARMGA